MTFKDVIQGNIQSSQGAACLQLGSVTVQKCSAGSEDNAFGEILGSKINQTAGRQYDVKKNNIKEEGIDAAGSEKSIDRPKFLTFEEANNRNVKAAASESKSVKNTKQSDIVSKADEEAEKSSAENVQSESKQYNVLCVFSQLFGIGINDLQKILKESGISIESFNSIEDINEISSRLSQIMELDKTQQDTLMKMLQLASDTLDACLPAENKLSGSAEEKLHGDAKQQDGIIKERNAMDQLSAAMKENQASEVIASDFNALTSDLESRIKMKLNEFGIRLKNDQGTIETELKDLIQLMSAKPTVKVQELQQQTEVTGTEENASQTAPVLDKNAKATASQDDNPNPDGYAVADKETTSAQPAAITEETHPQAAFAVIRTDQTNGVNAAAEKIPADTKEIISQVIENAKVILTPDKSEMVMDLKPDSLGKISLKVVTENGIVMAKFVAENQQVRQVLESNMQLLKDSLERQGMNVQGFSVSVRQDSRQSAGSWAQPGKSGSRSITRTEYGTAFMGSNLVEQMEFSGAANPYKWSGSTINLTA
ncbi:MAG: flagellar hook-length control protein FliK [Clostridiaceae bacterium]